MLRLILLMPSCLNARAFCRSIYQPQVASAIGSLYLLPISIMSNMSFLAKGSPPVIMTSGAAKEEILANKFSISWILSSFVMPCWVQEPLQCRHCKGQVEVTSKARMRS
ncbi:MAG: hypothetical protein DKM50_02360 [Candidatus Margulisiibacteriota bacterium]|nr:MAG: hypothetical protein DKM50_02360 [Candidatus Margulisiibacteriota bacterium]HCT85362.1 hypothetical protein [Candidatus Margulisiibacteriota bacterium]